MFPFEEHFHSLEVRDVPFFQDLLERLQGSPCLGVGKDELVLAPLHFRLGMRVERVDSGETVIQKQIIKII